MVNMFSITEAHRETGIPRKTLNNAVCAGRLPASQVTRGNGWTWMIEQGALMAYVARYKPQDETRWTRAWTDADVEAVIEMLDSCTISQIAAYVGRSERSTSIKIERLRAAGRLGYKPNTGRWGLNPFVMPKTGILLARTCLGCGLLRDATHYKERSSREGYQMGHCVRCMRQKGREKEATRQRTRDNKKESHNALQVATMPGAVNGGKEYTSAEIEVLSDLSKSHLQVALELGRTYSGVSNKRRKLGLTQEPPPLPSDTHWMIEFPNAAKALQEHYRALGVVPESEWDWNDDVA